MTTPYFSDREKGPRPRTVEEIGQPIWGGIIALIRKRWNDGSFGYGFPLPCSDDRGVYGCNANDFMLRAQAEIPGIPSYLDPNNVPDTLAILDLVEFCHRNIAKPVQRDYHSFFGHYHLAFETEEGKQIFRSEINGIFARNGMAYEMNESGQIIRLGPESIRETLKRVVFQTGDNELDSLLETSRVKFLDPDATVRREALEKLWDAWERLKTIEAGKDKKESISVLLDKTCSEPRFRKVLEEEATDLTNIGNSFGIRHRETTQMNLQSNEYIDYLFQRLFSLILLILKITQRCVL